MRGGQEAQNIIAATAPPSLYPPLLSLPCLQLSPPFPLPHLLALTEVPRQQPLRCVPVAGWEVKLRLQPDRHVSEWRDEPAVQCLGSRIQGQDVMFKFKQAHVQYSNYRDGTAVRASVPGTGDGIGLLSYLA